MGWEDVVISSVTILFIFSLLEQIYEILKSKKSGISIITSFLYFCGLFAMACAMYSLELYFSSVMTGINAVLWAALFVLSVRYKNN